MAEKKVFLTAEGMAKLKAELEHLRTVRRQEVAAQIQRAKELGSTVNNAEYEDAKNEQAFLEGRILTLEELTRNATVIPAESSSPEMVRVGSRVTVVDQDGVPQQYTIVGSAEAKPGDGRISNESPVGRALLGKRLGDEIKVIVPAGMLRLLLTEIK
ncbi:MAG: transcription elongation factor GreA [Chloroflexi bacterium]|nr:transcription elongation factor GreA [Chloroflexota bacterium]